MQDAVSVVVHRGEEGLHRHFTLTWGERETLTFIPTQDGMSVEFTAPEHGVELLRNHITPADASWEQALFLEKMAVALEAFMPRGGEWQNWVERFFEADLRRLFG
jgi:hypothetical protein